MDLIALPKFFFLELRFGIGLYNVTTYDVGGKMDRGFLFPSLFLSRELLIDLEVKDWG